MSKIQGLIPHQEEVSPALYNGILIIMVVLTFWLFAKRNSVGTARYGK